jgi:integrase
MRYCCACSSPRACAGVRRWALHWSDVDLTNGLLRVRGTLSRVNGHLVISEPKTERSRRDVPLSPATVALLGGSRPAKRSSGSRRPRSGLRRASCSPRSAGQQSTPGTDCERSAPAAGALGISDVGLHTLRHATRMLAAGVPLHTVSELLGHSCVAVTGGVYGHVSNRGARSAVQRLSAAMGW